MLPRSNRRTSPRSSRGIDMRLTTGAIAIAVACASGARPAVAQASPTEVVGAFFKAIAEERWRDAARELDLAAFDRYRRERVAAARLPWLRPNLMTVDEYMRQDTTMPRAVAEYQLRKMNESRPDPNAWLAREFADVPDIEALAALSVEEAAARWLQAADVRWHVRRAAEEQRKSGCELPPGSQSSLPQPSHRVLGEIRVDSTTAYVLHEDLSLRRAEPDVDAELHAQPPVVVTLRRPRDRWRILARDRMFRGDMVLGYHWPACIPGPRPRR